MIALLVTLWPDRPIVILTIEYRPPTRPARIAPPSLRTPCIDQAALTALAGMVDRERG